MLADVISAHTTMAQEDIEKLLSLSQDNFGQNELFLSHIKQLDEKLMQRSLMDVRALYREKLEAIKAEFGLANTTMSDVTVSNWILGYLKYPQEISTLIDQHQRVPVYAIINVLPHLLDILSDLEDEECREHWKRALILFTLPLIL